MEGLLLWRAGDSLLQLEWVETDGKGRMRVGGSKQKASHPNAVSDRSLVTGSCPYKRGQGKGGVPRTEAVLRSKGGS